MDKRTNVKISLLILLLFYNNLYADELLFSFKLPSFSGIGASAHYLTIENQEFNRKEAIKDSL